MIDFNFVICFYFQFASALYQPKVIRKYALRVLRNLLAKHEFDERYAGNAVSVLFYFKEIQSILV